MTCEEFKNFMNSDERFLSATQAGRMMLYMHTESCMECLQFVLDAPGELGPEMEELALEDYKVFSLFSRN